MVQFLKILIVEDQTITAMDIRETLEEAGHTVTDTARNYEEAVESVKKHPPDLAIIDIKLEDSAADGIITAEKILTLHSMPIIYLTASSERKTFQRAKETLPAAYLLKPFDPDELLMQVEVVWNYFKSTQPAYASDGLFFTIKNKGQHRIMPADVLYVEAEGSSTKVYVVQEKLPYEVSMNLSNVADYFTTSNFFRLSRSLLINLDHVARIAEEKVYLKNQERGLTIPSNSKQTLIQNLTIVKTK
jgi:DNA-binding LytR/AlgR family response regulator